MILINGSEPVNLDSIMTFTDAFLPYGLSKTAVRPSYGMAEATLFVSSIRPYTEPTAVYLDREQLGIGRRFGSSPTRRTHLAQVACGQVSVSQWAAIVDPESGQELPAVPAPSGLDDAPDVDPVRVPPKDSPRLRCVGDEFRRIPRPAGTFDNSQVASGYAPGSIDDFSHRVTEPAAEIEGRNARRFFQVLQTQHMGVGQVLNVNVVAYAGSVRRWIVSAEHRYRRV